ncbi:MAG: energy transducer TonB [Pyrinomonadaceae bacterium]|nr:energy transducer TonB [Pyrinomonadaceae bacterium]
MLKRCVWMSLVLSLLFAVTMKTTAQEIPKLKIATLTADENRFTEKFTAQFFLQLAKQKDLKLLDRDLTNAARRGIQVENLFNLSLTEAKNIGVAVDCEFYFIVRAENQRRSSSIKDYYFEASAVIFLVSTRTGNLIHWENAVLIDANEENAEKKLFGEIPNVSKRFLQKLLATRENELLNLNKNAKNLVEDFADLPEDAKAETDAATPSKFRAPLPYRRLRPNYTAAANKADVVATVDVFVYLNERGETVKVTIERWAGFDLDEETVDTIKKMQFRPASLDDKPLAVRVILRYNFRDINKDDE